jgi:autotransporter-associated beta strand protein
MGSGSPTDQGDAVFPGFIFKNSATAGSKTAFTAFGGYSELGVGGNIDFYDSTSADHATFDIDGSSGESYGTELGFFGSSTAANATIRIHRNGFLKVDGFNSMPTLGNAIVTNTEGLIQIFTGASAGDATITNIGYRQFSKTSMQVMGSSTEITTLANATIINRGGADASGRGSTSLGSFTGGSCTAADAVIMNNGGDGGDKLGGTVIFNSGSTAENATLIANPGTNGAEGGEIIFVDGSLGATARSEVFGNGSLDISQHDVPGMTIGSLEGDGLVFLGAGNLSVGSNGLSNLFSGVIQDGGLGGGTGGSLTKIGTGELTLSNANSYTGGTTVNDGILLVNNTSGSGTGSGSVQVMAGTLGGGGIIAGAVTIGTGSGAGAFLTPAADTTRKTTLTLQSSLAFQADSTYTYAFKAKGSQAKTDKVIANGVTINGGNISLQGVTQGTLRTGLVLTVIGNTSVGPISGTFANLLDGQIVTINGNNLRADYQGGDGNDLTLTVVP